MKTFSKTAASLAVLVFVLSAAAAPLAHDQTAPQNQAPPARDAEAKNLRKEIVRLKNVRATDIQNLLFIYLSREGRLQAHPNMPSVLVVSDTPENVDRILAAVRELDVKPPDVLYTVQLILGSETEATTDAELKNDPIIKELGKLLRYKSYTLLDATIVRTVNMNRTLVTFGPKAEFQLELRPEVPGDAKAPVIKTQVVLQQVHLGTPDKVVNTVVTKGLAASSVILIESTLNIKSGDRTVVGVSKLDGGDKGLILIISGKVVD